MLERFRSYLRIIAESQLQANLRQRVDLSGVVQQTLFEGHKEEGKLDDLSDDELAAWLRKALVRNLADEIRRACAQKRDVRREVELQSGVHASSARLVDFAVSDEPSPSQAVMRVERAIELSRGLELLSDDQRSVVIARYLRGQSLQVISDEMQKTKAAIAGLLQRGLRQLRQHLADLEK